MTELRITARDRLRLSALALCVLVAGCSGGERRSDTLAKSGAVLSDAVSGALGTDEPAEPMILTREQINQVPAAVISASRTESDLAYFAAYSVNNGRVTYYNASRQSLTLHGAALSSTGGLGVDLAGYRSDPEEDPLVRNRPLHEWPSRVTRVYRHHPELGAAFSRTFLCFPRAIGPETRILGELEFALVKVEEPCRSPSHSFVNEYWVDPAGGYVWRSRQWAGPDVGLLTLEVLRPFVP